MPSTYEQYIHRVGRTARATRGGRSLSLVGEGERKLLKSILHNVGHNNSIKHRVVPHAIIEKYQKELSEQQEEIDVILKKEKDDKLVEDKKCFVQDILIDFQ